MLTMKALGVDKVSGSQAPCILGLLFFARGACLLADAGAVPKLLLLHSTVGMMLGRRAGFFRAGV